MTEKTDTLDLPIWLDKRVEKFINFKGQITAIYKNMDENNWNKGSFSWHEMTVSEFEQVYRALREESRRVEELHGQLVMLLGLKGDAPDVEIAEAVKECGDWFGEMRKVYALRKKGDDSVKRT